MMEEVLEIIILWAGLSNLFLGLIVYLKDSSKLVNRLFGIFALITAVWVFTNFMMRVQQTSFWLKSTYAFGALVPASALLWVLELCNKKITKGRIFLLSSLGLLFFIISYLNNFVVANVKRVYLGGFEGTTGPLFIPYWLYILGFLIFIMYTVISEYRTTTRIKKLQLGYAMIGATFYMSTVLIVDFILPLFGIKEFIPLDSPSSLFLVFFTTLAIIRYHFFEIRVILTEILVGVIGILLLASPFLLSGGYRFLGLGVFLLFCFFAYYLVKATYQEIKRKEEAEKIATQERALRAEAEKLAQREAKMRKKEVEMRVQAEKLALRERKLKEVIGKIALEQKGLAEEKVEEIEELKKRISELEEELKRTKKQNTD